MAIYQAHIDRASAATLSGDYDAFAACISFPWRIRTGDHDLVFYDDDDHRKNFDLYTQGLKAKYITDLHRLVQEAWFVTKDMIEGTHISHLMHDGTRVHDPYFNRVRLVWTADKGWRETDCCNAILVKAGNFALFDHHSMISHPPELKELPERNTND